MLEVKEDQNTTKTETKKEKLMTPEEKQKAKEKVDKIINELYKNTNGEPKIYPNVLIRLLLLKNSIIKLIINGANKNFKNDRFDCSLKESFIY